jgi:hypothetical protein
MLRSCRGYKIRIHSVSALTVQGERLYLKRFFESFATPCDGRFFLNARSLGEAAPNPGGVLLMTHVAVFIVGLLAMVCQSKLDW